VEQAIPEVDIVPFQVAKFSLSNSGEHQKLKHRADVGASSGEDLANLLAGQEARGLLRDLHPTDFRHLFDVLVLDPELEDAGHDLELAVHRAGGDVLAHPEDFVGFNATHIDVACQAGEEGFQMRPDRDYPFAYRLRGEVDQRLWSNNSGKIGNMLFGAFRSSMRSCACLNLIQILKICCADPFCCFSRYNRA
jgi:hypothetical protein